MKKITCVLLFAAFFAATFISSCTKENLRDLTDSGSGQPVVCDTSFVLSYQNDIAPIIKSNCNDCHAANLAPFLGGGNVMDNYNSLKIYAENGTLLCTIQHVSGCPRMPDGAAKMSDCLISRIEAWVNQGIANN